MENLSITIERLIDAPVELLFDAWTRPEHLMKWWGPGPVTCPEAHVDLRDGGEYRIANRLEDGRVLWIRGEFIEIVRPTRLVYTWYVMDLDKPSRVTVTFDEHERGTLVRVVHERILNAEIAENHKQGWIGCLASLDEYLTA